MTKTTDRKGVADEVAEKLRAVILTGKYAAGEKLPPERELAKRMGVNRASLREALKRLEHQGLVSIRQGDGTRVTRYMETAGLELISHLLPLATPAAPDIIREVLEFRRIYGREVARLAAERATESDLERLTEIANAAAADGVSPEELFSLDFQFYVALTQASRNRVIGLLINTVRDAVASYTPILLHLNVSTAEVCSHHRAMIRALRKRNTTVAARVADRYLKAGADHVLALMNSGRVDHDEADPQDAG